MKATNLTKLAWTYGLITTVLLIAGSVASITAADITSGKGAAKLLMKPAASSSVAMPTDMTCAKCTDRYTSVRDLSAKGANKPVTLVAQHQCKGCSTSIATIGAGKSKQNVALHTCASGPAQNANCCARN